MKTGIVFHKNFLQHLTGQGHPESPARLSVIINALSRSGLMYKENTLVPRMGKIEDVLLCHTPHYVALVQKEVSKVEDLGILSTGDTMISSRSGDAAFLAVGAAITAVDAVMESKFNSVFCAVRPPGHHATSSCGMGFCIFNNAAIAARYAQKKHGIERVLIVDWDVHHGNGTQEIFESDPSVFYFSTHQWPLYPFTGNKDETGVGNIMNCPIEAGPGARQHILQAFETKLAVAMERVKPNLVVISAGFDAHVEDPLGGLDLTEDDFATLTTYVKRIADKYAKGRIVSLLEGGYNLEALAKSVVAHLRALES